jgi:hypothetical protein
VTDFSPRADFPWHGQKDDFRRPRAAHGKRCCQVLVRIAAGETAES